MIVYRFQNTKELETNSYCEDIMNIYLSYKERSEEDGITEELVDDVAEEWGQFIDWRLSSPPFEEFSVFEWVEKILSFETEEEAYAFQMEHKMAGVFAIEPTSTLEEAFQLSVRPEMGLGNHYLIEAEAEVLEDFGREFGLLVKLEKIIRVHKTPSHYVEEALAN